MALSHPQIFSFCSDFAPCCQSGNTALALHPAHHSEALGSKICILGKLNSSSQTCLSLFGISKTTNNRVRNKTPAVAKGPFNKSGFRRAQGSLDRETVP